MIVSLIEIYKEIEYISDFFSKKFFIIENNIKKEQNNTISWEKYQTGIYKENYIIEFQNLKNNFQYTFLLKDGAFFQFYYEVDSESVLKKMKLAYYPLPKETRKVNESFIEGLFDSNCEMDECLEEELIYLLDNLNDIVFSNTSSIRIDYDANVSSHSKCEIQIAAINKFRIPLNHLISPMTFFDLICRNLYGDIFNSMLNKDYKEKLNQYIVTSLEVDCLKENIFAKLHIL